MNQDATASPQMTAEWISGWDAVAGLREEWTGLHRADDTLGAHLFNDFDFLDVWQNHFGHDRELAVLTVRDAGGTMVGVAPLQIEKTPKRPISFRRLGFMGNSFVSRVSAVMRGDVTAIAAAMAQTLAAKSRLFDDIVFEEMLADCPAQSALRAAIVKIGFLTIEIPNERPLHVVAFDGTEADYVQNSTRANRKKFNLAIRRCTALPDFKVTVTTDAARSRDLHRQLFSLDWLSGKTDRPGAIYPVAAKHFHTVLGERADVLGGIEFIEAWTDGQLIASIMSIVNLHIKYLYVTYFDDAYREQTPGVMVILRAIGTGLEDPAIKHVDLNGDSKFLERLSTDTIERVTFKANHRAGLSSTIGLARMAKRLIT